MGLTDIALLELQIIMGWTTEKKKISHCYAHKGLKGGCGCQTQGFRLLHTLPMILAPWAGTPLACAFTLFWGYVIQGFRCASHPAYHIAPCKGLCVDETSPPQLGKNTSQPAYVEFCISIIGIASACNVDQRVQITNVLKHVLPCCAFTGHGLQPSVIHYR
jgi:hypothetical protein